MRTREQEAALRERWHQARQHFADIEVGLEAFGEFVQDAFARQQRFDDLADWLAQANTDELYLACACIDGDAQALRYFDETYGELLAYIARRFEQSEYAQEDLVQLLREQLFVASDDRPAKLGHYGGVGTLESWIRVTATRFFIDLLRTGSQRAYEATHFDDELLDRFEDDDANQELRFLKEKYRADFKAAFQRAFDGLDSEQRNLLRQRVVGQLGVRQIGALYGMHASTVSRRLAEVRQTLLDETRRLLKCRLEVDSDELDSIIRLIDSKLEVSLSRLLRESTTPEEQTEP